MTGRGSNAGQAPRPIETVATPPARREPEPSAGNGAAQHNGIGPDGGTVPHDDAHPRGDTPLAVTPRDASQPGPNGPQRPSSAPVHGPIGERSSGCTAPQLRRFIKSRPYVPMHELRRRFGINGNDDDVTPVRMDAGWVYVGLPPHEGTLLGDLLRAGEIGYELSLDPRAPIVIGVYPMRPIPRG